MFPRRRTTREDWKILGCFIFAIGLATAGLGLYACIKLGFDNPLAVRVLVTGVALSVFLAGLRYAIARYLG